MLIVLSILHFQNPIVLVTVALKKKKKLAAQLLLQSTALAPAIHSGHVLGHDVSHSAGKQSRDFLLLLCGDVRGQELNDEANEMRQETPARSQTEK